MSSSAKGKIALVTGANKGIGFETAKQIGKAGCFVYVGARNPKLGDEAVAKLKAEGVDAEFVEIDLVKPESITSAAKRVESKHGKLDILVNNAGIIDQADGPPSATNVDAVERVLNTNFLGTVRVTQAMLPLLRNADSASIVNVSSGLGSLTQNSDPNWPYAAVKILGYCASKAALNMFTAQLAYELKDTNIMVNSSDPGYTATDLNGNQGHQTIEEGSEATVKLALLGKGEMTGAYIDKDGTVPW